MTDGVRRAQRAEALRDLIELRVPVKQAATALAQYPWDSDEELDVLTRADALRLLSRYKRQELTPVEVQHWAEALEGRDDLGLEHMSEDLLKEFLFQIATPELADRLTPEVATRWEATLKESPQG
ncbi:MAG TPA: hypothetical protein VK735_37730 [Pseudonocardia sp.]|uniref:hypothetical protein n=1 Tax=Pseudonocardia sp. TaxID=60912 RepID=UPI002C22253F|nr:hypothetical protein [Pseudonocardia sp.]HTF53221.1 hypothetical protein [Pseudonocardia sp.]